MCMESFKARWCGPDSRGNRSSRRQKLSITEERAKVSFVIHGLSEEVWILGKMLINTVAYTGIACGESILFSSQQLNISVTRDQLILERPTKVEECSMVLSLNLLLGSFIYCLMMLLGSWIVLSFQIFLTFDSTFCKHSFADHSPCFGQLSQLFYCHGHRTGSPSCSH